MGRQNLILLPGEHIWVCKLCGTHLVDNNDLLSKNYHASTGDAFLFVSAVNFCRGKMKEERLRTGVYRTSDIHCLSCNQRLGWIYEIAYVEEQKFKEGKVILEKACIECIAQNDEV
mmetsp:Transcript_7195/g.9980  ORF Transcript_7195/g.9980 Transcript_7195/m.9980 type:complete len:116 (-) Transcript_7195:83-430(-)